MVDYPALTTNHPTFRLDELAHYEHDYLPSPFLGIRFFRFGIPM